MKAFYLPVRIVTGEGCFATLAEHVAQYGQRAFLVCGTRSLRSSGRLDQAVSTLRNSGIPVSVYDAVSGEPTLDMVQDGINHAKADQADVIVGIGGGSAIDTAKAIAGLYTHPGTVGLYLEGRLQVHGGGLPWIGIPTTAGTGAEVTKNAVLISTQRTVKESLRHDGWFASVVLIDPELTLDMPPDITAATGADALTQAIESYTSVGAMEMTDALATDAIVRIGRSLERACRNGQDRAARADMLYGSMLAGCAMANARLGGVHGMAHPLGVRHGIPHGVVCGLLLPHTMAYNLGYAAGKYARVAQMLGVDTNGVEQRLAAERAVERVQRIVQAIQLPLHLSLYGVQRGDLALIAQESLPQGSLKHNPRPLSAQDVEMILEAAL